MFASLSLLFVRVVFTGTLVITFLIRTLQLHLYPSESLYLVFGFPLCSIYCNTLLANLNARAYIQGETATVHTDAGLHTSSISRAFDGTGGDKHRASRVVSFRRSGKVFRNLCWFGCPTNDGHILANLNAEGHGGVTFLVGNRSAPTSEEASV